MTLCEKYWNHKETTNLKLHVNIGRCGRPTASLYFNYEGYFSMILMAACDANCNLTWVDVGDYDHKNDNSVFATS
ncbi:hypothetical protein PR048_031914 [Dryococelus australis]|uniref:Uncharacterized protein n=1 Tax=Dryococelus australis TaxID=614101 RepID=A0ABQ9G6M9_9NEOP|nr:hypothetical protein PR048_031914 [Dryococelus australis]